jgi:hypothetical protein
MKTPELEWTQSGAAVPVDDLAATAALTRNAQTEEENRHRTMNAAPAEDRFRGAASPAGNSEPCPYGKNSCEKLA